MNLVMGHNERVHLCRRLHHARVAQTKWMPPFNAVLVNAPMNSPSIVSAGIGPQLGRRLIAIGKIILET
jgi:hypothetical protein